MGSDNTVSLYRILSDTRTIVFGREKERRAPTVSLRGDIHREVFARHMVMRDDQMT